MALMAAFLLLLPLLPSSLPPFSHLPSRSFLFSFSFFPSTHLSPFRFFSFSLFFWFLSSLFFIPHLFISFSHPSRVPPLSPRLHPHILYFSLRALTARCPCADAVLCPGICRMNISMRRAGPALRSKSAGRSQVSFPFPLLAQEKTS